MMHHIYSNYTIKLNHICHTLLNISNTFIVPQDQYTKGKMCFSGTDSDDSNGRFIRTSEFRRSRRFKILLQAQFSRRCPSPPPSPPTMHIPRTTTTLIVYSPRPSVYSVHCSPPSSPRTSYTTITRRYVRTRQEIIYPIERRSLVYRGCDPREMQYVEYAELGRRRASRDVEYIPSR
ncbi:hypothetical protein BDV12DRAFT_171649 [Aspergillus spectabilis]